MLKLLFHFKGYTEQQNKYTLHVIFQTLIICVCGMLAFANVEMKQTYSVLSLFSILFACKTRSLKYLFPPIILFYEFLVLPGGVSVFRLFTILYLGAKIYEKEDLSIRTGRKILYLFIAFLYAVIVIGLDTGDFRQVTFLLFDIYVFFVFIQDISKSKENFHLFATTLIIAVCCSGISSLTSNVVEESAVLVDGKYVEVNRLLGTFTDSNYFSIFVNAAIFSCLIIRPIPKTFRIIALVILYYSLFASVSITGLLSNILGIGVILYLKKQIKPGTLIMLAIICIGIYFLLMFISTNYETSFIHSFIARIQSKMQGADDLGAVTSSRTILWEEHWDYYLHEQGLFSQLFGGNRISAVSTTQALSHQDYLDMLLCVGLLGALLILIPNIKHSIELFRQAVSEEEEDHIINMVMFKYLYFFYAFGLTMFLDYKFFIFVLL